VPLIVAKVFSVSHANAEFPEIIFTPLLWFGLASTFFQLVPSNAKYCPSDGVPSYTTSFRLPKVFVSNVHTDELPFLMV
jgi:hypothetical protein